MKRFLYYFIWTLVIGFVVFWGLQLQELLVERSKMTFSLSPLRVYTAFFPLIIGLLLRMPKFILEMREQKVNSFDWIKFMAIGLPTLVVLVLSFLPYLPISEGWVPVFNMSINAVLYSGTTLPTITGLIFGYVLLDSFKNSESTQFKKET